MILMVKQNQRKNQIHLTPTLPLIWEKNVGHLVQNLDPLPPSRIWDKRGKKIHFRAVKNAF